MIDDHLSDDPALARLVARRPGLRVPGGWDRFETAVRAVLGQQISVAAAGSIGWTVRVDQEGLGHGAAVESDELHVRNDCATAKEDTSEVDVDHLLPCVDWIFPGLEIWTGDTGAGN
jgi:hypothetical protein